MLEKIKETAEFLKSVMKTQPETAIILGTGLGSLVNEITEKYEVQYKDIPNFPLSTVEGHSGKLIFGKLGNKDIMAMQGRFHYYEGYSMKKQEFGKQNWFILILFGLIGQIAWSVENMYFNLFVFETISPNLDAVTLMVQLSGIAATIQ